MILLFSTSYRSCRFSRSSLLLVRWLVDFVDWFQIILCSFSSFLLNRNLRLSAITYELFCPVLNELLPTIGLGDASLELTLLFSESNVFSTIITALFAISTKQVFAVQVQLSSSYLPLSIISTVYSCFLVIFLFLIFVHLVPIPR
jgi:hypothetical protein